ncbi:MAG TPA: hypothetical protein VE152_13985 [Acidimicrobiales bacterium]|nr:hypothetical protein [Acidimicrobiales bacterium]
MEAPGPVVVEVLCPRPAVVAVVPEVVVDRGDVVVVPVVVVVRAVVVVVGRAVVVVRLGDGRWAGAVGVVRGRVARAGRAGPVTGLT